MFNKTGAPRILFTLALTSAFCGGANTFAQSGSHGKTQKPPHERHQQQQQQQQQARCPEVAGKIDWAQEVLKACGVEFDPKVFTRLEKRVNQDKLFDYPIYALRVHSAFKKLKTQYQEEFLPASEGNHFAILDYNHNEIKTPAGGSCQLEEEANLKAIEKALREHMHCFKDSFDPEYLLIPIALPVMAVEAILPPYGQGK